MAFKDLFKRKPRVSEIRSSRVLQEEYNAMEERQIAVVRAKEKYRQDQEIRKVQRGSGFDALVGKLDKVVAGPSRQQVSPAVMQKSVYKYVKVAGKKRSKKSSKGYRRVLVQPNIKVVEAPKKKSIFDGFGEGSASGLNYDYIGGKRK